MKNFKTYIFDKPQGNSILVEKAKKEPEKKTEPKDEISDTGEWVRASNGWLIHFKVGGQEYVASFSPIDDAEKHFKFTYYRHGQRDSSDIKKFGAMESWLMIWKTLIEIIKDFIRIFHPATIKFIGMSISKRGVYFREIFKLYVKNYIRAFKKLGYHSSFDYHDLSVAPSFVVRKGEMKEPEKKEDEKEKPEKGKKE